jgi:hypothetical protein
LSLRGRSSVNMNGAQHLHFLMILHRPASC